MAAKVALIDVSTDLETKCNDTRDDSEPLVTNMNTTLDGEIQQLIDNEQADVTEAAERIANLTTALLAQISGEQ